MIFTYIAEAIGTGALSLAVLLSLTTPGLTDIIATPLLAAVVVGIFVYAIGPLTGCHLNPAVTVAALSLKQIKPRDALGYILGQAGGAAVAFFIATFALDLQMPSTAYVSPFVVLLGEILGTWMLTFGVGAVIFGKVPPAASGLVIGSSLLVGVIFAVGIGSAGVLNPAVAFAIGSFNALYIFGPIVGAVLGMWSYRIISARAG
jgi:glycerol uptake facilitator-like aquaporin